MVLNGEVQYEDSMGAAMLSETCHWCPHHLLHEATVAWAVLSRTDCFPEHLSHVSQQV
jgi:hypothetical protein